MSQTFSDADGRQVVASSTATEIGQIKSFVVDPSASRVTAIQTGGRGGRADVVEWDHIEAFGEDAVLVVNDEVAHRPEDRQKDAVKGNIRLRDSRVLDDAGFEHGTVTDAMFDPATGAITGVLTTEGHLAADRLISLGSYALVIRAET